MAFSKMKSSIEKMTSRDFQSDCAAHVVNIEHVLKDNVTNDYFRNVLRFNRHLFQGRTILNVGCGVGLIALFCAKEAKAARVIAIDNSNVVEYARQLVVTNGYEDIIYVHQGSIQSMTKLPGGIREVDVIICNWMGHCLFYESLCDDVIWARDHWLRTDGNGLILPDMARVYIAGIRDNEYKQDRIDWWRNVEGFNMKQMRDYARSEPFFRNIGMKKVMTVPVLIKEVNMYTITQDDLIIENRLNLKSIRDGNIDGLMIYFKVLFTISHVPMVLSSAPGAPVTQWLQTAFYFDKSITVKEGRHVEGSITLDTPWKNYKEYDVNNLCLRVQLYCPNNVETVSEQWNMLSVQKKRKPAESIHKTKESDNNLYMRSTYKPTPMKLIDTNKNSTINSQSFRSLGPMSGGKGHTIMHQPIKTNNNYGELTYEKDGSKRCSPVEVPKSTMRRTLLDRNENDNYGTRKVSGNIQNREGKNTMQELSKAQPSRAILDSGKRAENIKEKAPQSPWSITKPEEPKMLTNNKPNPGLARAKMVKSMLALMKKTDNFERNNPGDTWSISEADGRERERRTYLQNEEAKMPSYTVESEQRFDKFERKDVWNFSMAEKYEKASHHIPKPNDFEKKIPKDTRKPITAKERENVTHFKNKKAFTSLQGTSQVEMVSMLDSGKKATDSERKIPRDIFNFSMAQQREQIKKLQNEKASRAQMKSDKKVDSIERNISKDTWFIGKAEEQAKERNLQNEMYGGSSRVKKILSVLELQNETTNFDREIPKEVWNCSMTDERERIKNLPNEYRGSSQANMPNSMLELDISDSNRKYNQYQRKPQERVDNKKWPEEMNRSSFRGPLEEDVDKQDILDKLSDELWATLNALDRQFYNKQQKNATGYSSPDEEMIGDTDVLDYFSKNNSNKTSTSVVNVFDYE